MFTLDALLTRRQAGVRGLLAVVLGVVALVWPGLTIGVAVALFAIYCFADAITRFAGLFGSGEPGGQRALALLVALVDVAAGVVAIAYPGITAGVLVIVIGIWAIIVGATEIAAALSAGGSVLGPGWLALIGVLSAIAGVLLIAWPNIGAVTIAVVFGIYLLVYGVTLLAAAAVTPKGEPIGDARA
jgi:uncharacterized membrane protein HdeD (DUF308 family)